MNVWFLLKVIFIIINIIVVSLLFIVVILGKVYITEAKQFHLLRSQYGILPKLTICTTPRQPVDLPKVRVLEIIVF